jgi:anaerobic selenocysteine-containing dehydrogenase
MAPMPDTHYRTCNLCEAMCGIEIEVEGDRVVSIRGDKQDPFSRGYICPKATALEDVHTDPDRLRRPMRRTAGGWEEISWDEALAETAERLAGIQREHGRNAVGLYAGNPTVHNWGALVFGMLFSRTLRTHSRFSATSVDQLPHHVVGYFMYGHSLLLPIPDIDRTDFLLMLGANPLASNGSLMTAPDVGRRLKAIRDRGGRVVVVDPRRTETAAAADRHHFIRPGTDVLLLLAMLHTIVEEGLARPGRLEALADGWEEVERLAEDFSPERVAPVTGISADDTRALARDLAAARAGVCYGRMGISTQEFGAAAQWLVHLLNAVTGNLDREGGAMFTKPAIDLVALATRAGQRGHYARRRSRVRGLPEFGGEYPVAALAEEILTPGDGRIRALVTVAGNPVLSTPNGRQLDRALESLDFMVSVDCYLNETTRHANIILPPTSALEHDNYDLVFHVLAIRNTAKYSPALFRPDPDARHEWEIFHDLTNRMGPRDVGSRVRAGLFNAAVRLFGPEVLLDLGLRFGPYGSGWNPFADGLTLGRLKAAPHGVDLGPLEPCLPERLQTKTGRIQLVPDVLAVDLTRVRERFFGEAAAEVDGDRLLLVGRRHLRSNNSWLHNSRRLVRGKPRCTLMIHPEDAARRGLVDGEMASVRSRVGAVEIQVEVTDAVMPGVVSIPHGWGHDREGTRLRTANAHAGASLNDLTDDLAIDALSGNAAFSGVPVVVAAAGSSHQAVSSGRR